MYGDGGPLAEAAHGAKAAASLAWLVVLPLGRAAETYAHYVPPGAVFAVSTTLVDSIRASCQSLGAIFLGAFLACGAADVSGGDPAGPGCAPADRVTG
ncbi:hypothetical protein C6I20_07290 [Aeromicrobium sp. A1-2]|uniref:hypothetical protein n=1 Tax=Aeromicrobium sp. A1-2 TaxID=2107713 RepID=UPI000E4AC9B6|nr:hypothetical protein [Aeromicrobium sp. A1-2]AXT85008.1 hypothetical protein C6I20_07290 [Aeromicrobium sp. A1-2]